MGMTDSGPSRRGVLAGAAALALPTAALRAAETPLTVQRLRVATVGRRDVVALLAWPREVARGSKVMLVHDSRGLNPAMVGIIQQMARAGLVVLAPDFLTSQGETPRSGDGEHSADDIARVLTGRLDPAAVAADALAMLTALDSFDGGPALPAAMGIGWGGGVVNTLAVAAGRRLRAAAVIDGTPPADVGGAARVKARMQLHTAAGSAQAQEVAAWQQALAAAGVKVEGFGYPGVQPGFANPAAPRYDAAAGALAIERVTAFLS